MGALDQFAKLTFEEETEIVTNGGAVWCLPPELGLSDVRLDGMLLVRDAAQLAKLAAPWSQTGGLDEICLEVKMPGDHLSVATLERALLRRQARQVQRAEDEAKPPWEEQEPLWLVAPHLPGFLEKRRTLMEVASGCYRVETGAFQFLWIAANELPLREDLFPFLVVRSGRALDDFGRWLITRRPRMWMLNMVSMLSMTTAVRDNLMRWIDPGDDPEIVERQRHMVRWVFGAHPELEAEVTAKGQLSEARKMVCRTLSRRKLTPTAEEQARIDACADLAALERWHDQAIDALTVADALR
jgi:hypothetical protein